METRLPGGMSNTSPLIATKGLGLAGVAALGACAACCALPLLAAAGIGGGALSAVAGYIRPGADLILAGGVGVSVLAVMAFRARARRAEACDVACAVDGGCGCPAEKTKILSTPSPRADEPIVCTADMQDEPTVLGQLDSYRAAFEHLRSVERFEGGVRWVFANRPGLGSELRNLAEKEHQCCSIFKFDLRDAGESIIWETTARREAVRVLDEFARLPERLNQHARGSEVAPIKRAIGDAGLNFAADASGAK